MATEKKFRQLSDEELKKVNGGSWTIAGGAGIPEECKDPEYQCGHPQECKMSCYGFDRY